MLIGYSTSASMPIAMLRLPLTSAPAPNAMLPKSPAMARVPKAMASKPTAALLAPNAKLPSPSANAFDPNAMLRAPHAWLHAPIAMLCSPCASLCSPSAIAPSPGAMGTLARSTSCDSGAMSVAHATLDHPNAAHTALAHTATRILIALPPRRWRMSRLDTLVRTPFLHAGEQIAAGASSAGREASTTLRVSQAGDALFDGDRLRQVARLVHVRAARERRVVGQQLHRDRMHDRREHAHVARGADHVHRFAFAELAVRIGEHEHLAATRAHFLDIRLHLLEQAVVGRDHDDRHRAVHQRERTMLEFARRVGLGVDVRDFLEFERTFQRDRVVHAAAEEQRVLLHRELLRPRHDLRFQVQRVLHAPRQLAQRVEEGLLLLRIQAAAQLRERGGQREQRDELRGE